MGTPGRQASAEEVRRLDPEVIIAAWCGAGERVPLEKIIEERGWQRTAAALSGRVFCIRDEFLNTPAPTLLQGLRGAGLRDSSRTVPLHERNPADYSGSRFHGREFDAVS